MLPTIVFPLRRWLVAAAAGLTWCCSAATALRAQAPTALIVRGTVADSAGAAIPRATVTATDPNGRTTSGRTAADGGFSLTLAGDGRYGLSVRAVGFQPWTDARTLATAGAPLRITLRSLRILAPVQVVGAAGAGRDNGHLQASDLAGSVSVLSGEQISREQVTFAQELLRKVPGIYRAEFNQGIVAGDIGVRGFNTESEIGSTKLLIDGIPANMNSGVTEMNALFPLEISRMEVVRGTNDPRFGLFNLAGNVSVETAQGGSYLTSRLQRGSFGTEEGQLLAAWEQQGFSQTLFAGLRRSTGYRDNSGQNKWSMSGKWFYQAPSSRVRVGVIARTHRLDAEAPGYLTEAQSRATPTLSPAFSASDGGSVGSDHGSLHVDVRQTSTFNWSLKAYAQRFNRIRYVRFTAGGAQQERVEDERQSGVIATATWRPAALATRHVALMAGADAQRTDNLQLRYRAVERQRQAVLRDHAFALDNGGGFVQLTGSPWGRLQLTVGARADRFYGDFDNRTTSTFSNTPILNYGWIAQPKASATLRITDRVSTYANYGRGFQIGSGIASYGRTPLRASRNDGVEGGVVSTPLSFLSVRAGVWQQNASDEVRLRFDNSGDSENIGRTRRTGVDVESSVRLPRGVSAWVAATSQRARLVEPGLTNAAARGKLLNHVPNWTVKYGADWSPLRGLQLSFWSYQQGDYDIIPTNDRGRWGSISTVNTDISWRVRALAVGLGTTNLFNRYNEYVWWDGTQTLHSPAAPRSVFLTFSVDR